MPVSRTLPLHSKGMTTEYKEVPNPIRAPHLLLKQQCPGWRLATSPTVIRLDVLNLLLTNTDGESSCQVCGKPFQKADQHVHWICPVCNWEVIYPHSILYYNRIYMSNEPVRLPGPPKFFTPEVVTPKVVSGDTLTFDYFACLMRFDPVCLCRSSQCRAPPSKLYCVC